MKIVIVGAGLTGLSTYLYLKKYLPESTGVEITIYERHTSSHGVDPRTRDNPAQVESTAAIIGGGLGVAANGMRVLHYLSPKLHARCRASGLPTNDFALCTSAGTLLGRIPAVSQSPTEEQNVMISWKGLWENLRREIPEQGVLVTGRKVVAVESDGTVHFDDREIVKADLVIGADGVRSTCRKVVLQKGEKGDPEFQGLLNFGGFIPTEELPKGPAGLPDVVMTFGRRGFFGYTPCVTESVISAGQTADNSFSKPMHMWWSTHSGETPEVPAAVSNESRQKLKDMHGDCSNPVIQYIINNATPDLSIPTWIAPVLSKWYEGRVILVGDAAHALPSSSGQGVSQGFEDAVTVSALVAAALKTSNGRLGKEMISEIGDRYMKLRKQHVDEIRDVAIRMQGRKTEMSPLQVYLAYAMVWLFTKITSKDKVTAVLDYDAKALVDAEVEKWIEARES